MIVSFSKPPDLVSSEDDVSGQAGILALVITHEATIRLHALSHGLTYDESSKVLNERFQQVLNLHLSSVAFDDYIFLFKITIKIR